MLSKEELQHWYQQIKISPEAQTIIERIRSSEPVRHVQNYRANVSGRFPSKKMGVTIQFESHHNELAFIYEYEHDLNVLEYYDQPSQIKLIYEGKNDKKITALHTPDFFVLRKDSVGWEECKTEQDLIKLAEKSPTRYCLNEKGEWYCPPGEISTKPYGFYYKIRSSKEINWTVQRNFLFLEDYLRNSSYPIKNSSRDEIIKTIFNEQGISLKELFQKTESIATRDDVYWLIATKEIFIDFTSSLLIEPEKVKVYTNKEIAIALHNSSLKNVSNINQLPQSVILAIGSSIVWDGNIWKIMNVGKTLITLYQENNAISEIPLPTFESFVKEGKISGILMDRESAIDSEMSIILSKASIRDLEEANRRYNIILGYLEKKDVLNEINLADRTLRLWLAKYRKSVINFGNGYIGLLPKTKKKGNRKNKISLKSQQLMQEFISNNYETPKQKPKYEVWCSLKLACEREGVTCPSYKTFCLTVNKQDSYKQKLKRSGYRSAYDIKPFCWILDQNTSRHGDRPLEICHIDHTQLDIELVCSNTKLNLGRPWVTFLIDAYSRRILSLYLCFDSPSYRSCMMVLRECVHLHGRLPQVIIVDNGPEFKSVYFETLLARYECTKKNRPPAQARFGSVCERIFGTSNSQFIHNLFGNTQITKKPRQITKGLNPKEQAIWTLENLYIQLCKYAYDVYDNNYHSALGQSPKEAFLEGMAQTGNRPQKLIPYNKDFLIWTLPTTTKGTAKIQRGKGIQVNSILYWSNEFKDPQVENKSVPIRYDPYNIAITYAFVGNQWIECCSEYYSVFQGRTEKEIILATKEIHARNKNRLKQYYVNSKKIADFLESVELEEETLKQNLCNKEQRKVLDLLTGIKQNENPPDKKSLKLEALEDEFEFVNTSLERKIMGEF